MIGKIQVLGDVVESTVITQVPIEKESVNDKKVSKAKEEPPTRSGKGKGDLV